jgi:hypothetical protein
MHNRLSLILENSAAEEHRRETQEKTGNGASEYQGSIYHAVVGAKQNHIGKLSDLNAISKHALFKEVIEGICRL